MSAVTRTAHGQAENVFSLTRIYAICYCPAVLKNVPIHSTAMRMKTTLYFEHIRKRPDRAIISEEWIMHAIRSPVKTEMKVKYFSDTDTAFVEFTDKPVAETKEIGENIYVDLDSNGNLVSMTIGHARKNARLQEFSYQEIDNSHREGGTTG